MKIQSVVKKVSTVSLLTAAFALSLGSTTYAHVTVKPAEAVTSGYQTFTVSVPNEKEISTVSVKVVMPSGIVSATPTQKAGWQIIKETEGTGEDATTKSITWEGGSISDGTRDEFTFSAKTPEKAAELQWKAYQTYADGTVVAWDKASEGGHGHGGEANSGPFSVTKIVTETTQDAVSKKTDQAAADAQLAAERALYVGIAALVVSIIGVFLVTRKK